MAPQQTVLITGATSGIGAAIAVALQDCYRLIIHGRDNTKLTKIHRSLKIPENHCTWNYDLAYPQEIDQSLEQLIKKEMLVVNHYVHCAGAMQLKPLKILNYLDLLNIYNTNVISAALIVKALIAKNINQSNLRSVVFISSNLSGNGAKALSSYGSSKSALDGLMACLAVELAPKVRFNSVLPGAILTPMTAEIFSDSDKKVRMEATYPLGLGDPKAIVNAVEFLLSDKSSWITGQKIVVDGGRSINLTA